MDRDSRRNLPQASGHLGLLHNKQHLGETRSLVEPFASIRRRGVLRRCQRSDRSVRRVQWDQLPRGHVVLLVRERYLDSSIEFSNAIGASGRSDGLRRSTRNVLPLFGQRPFRPPRELPSPWRHVALLLDQQRLDADFSRLLAGAPYLRRVRGGFGARRASLDRWLWKPVGPWRHLGLQHNEPRVEN